MKTALKVLVNTFLLMLAVRLVISQEKLTDPYEILTKHYEAIGGMSALKAEKTRYYVWNFSLVGAGLKGTLKEWEESPLRNRKEVDLGVVKQIQGDNGEFLWKVDANRKIQIQKDKETMKEREVRRLLNLFEHTNPESPYFRLRFEGIQMIGEVECYTLKIVNTINEDIIYEYFDTSTFYRVKQTLKQPAFETQTLYSEYQDIEGIQRPFRQEIEILPIKQKQILELETYEINREVDPSLFEPPGRDIEDFHFFSSDKAENIPFQFFENHILLPVNIERKERLWALDSGASMTVIDAQYADELGLKREGKILGMGAGSTFDAYYVSLPEYRIPGIQFKSQKVVSIEIPQVLKSALGMDFGGILGYDFLSRFVTKIDYSKQLISFYHATNFSYKGKGKAVDAPLVDNIFQVPITIDGKYSGKCTFDLGAGQTSLNYPFAEENGLLNLKGVEKVGVGVGSEFTLRISQFQSLEIAGFTVENPLIMVPIQKGIGQFARKNLLGNLGNDIFQHFVLYIDYSHQQVIFEKGDNFNGEFPQDRSGLQIFLTESGEFEVHHVAPGTPGARAGFQRGDIIQSVNGIAVNNLLGVNTLRKLLMEKQGTKYTFTVRRDRKLRNITLTLQDLFKQK